MSFSDRDPRFKKPPASLIEIELSGLIGKAVALGRIEIQCIKKKLTWAAYYSEKKKFDALKEEFLKLVQPPTITLVPHASSKSPKVKRPVQKAKAKVRKSKTFNYMCYSCGRKDGTHAYSFCLPASP